VGHRAEMAVLEDELARAAAGEFRVVLLSGETGLGKSRLGREVLARHPDAAGMFVRAHPLGVTAAFGVWEGSAQVVAAAEDCGDRFVAMQGLVASGYSSVLRARPIPVTGDNEATARAVVAAAGIDEVIAGALPDEKAHVIAGLQAARHRVAMVGDGVNDAPALAAADLGLALGSGTDVAICAADLILLRDDLSAVTDAISLARDVPDHPPQPRLSVLVQRRRDPARRARFPQSDPRRGHHDTVIGVCRGQQPAPAALPRPRDRAGGLTARPVDVAASAQAAACPE